MYKIQQILKRKKKAQENQMAIGKLKNSITVKW